MAQLRASQFSALCDSVQSAITSLTCCRSFEVAAEARILNTAIEALSGAELMRKHGRLLEQRRSLLRRANEVLARRAVPRAA